MCAAFIEFPITYYSAAYTIFTNGVYFEKKYIILLSHNPLAFSSSSFTNALSKNTKEIQYMQIGLKQIN